MSDRRSSGVPTWGLIATRRLELRKRRGLMVAVVLLTVGLPVIFLGIRLLLHVVDPGSYGPAGSPTVFAGLTDPMYAFGFIIAATLGATAGTTDLTDGVFRQLVVTGRSRLALYLARIPAGLSILVPLVAVAFTLLCLTTSYLGTPDPPSIDIGTLQVPTHLDQSQLESWLVRRNPTDLGQLGEVGPITRGRVVSGYRQVTNPGPRSVPTDEVRTAIRSQIGTYYAIYHDQEVRTLNPAPDEMAKIGLWIELEVVIGFTVGLGFGSLVGQRTIATIIMIVLEIVVTPIAANVKIPHFLNGQRVVVGVAMDQLRPAGLVGGFVGRGGPGQGVLGIPPMPKWAMVAVIVGWIVVWTIIGAWRMVTRDA